MLNSVISESITLESFLICVFAALVLGLLTALVFTAHGHHTGSLTLSLAMLPPVVALIIMLVNGNIGAGLAVAGTFALVRFRSVPGSAKEITGLFFAVSLGLACGMGYVAVAGIFFVIIALFLILLERLRFGQDNPGQRQLKITIPENLDYDGLFDDLLDEYAIEYELIRVRTTNMGTLYELTYNIRLRGRTISKEFIDQLRCRNGNLTVSCGRETERDMM
ncbi:MAG: DUF4956 domain-containing protein [Candidatus Limivicinus sp.]|nr:DUF4956 domain-containing protein [Clostridiales bacterium]MDY3860473.1 DUF4956 domain-containing protein [Candidatus Limivicinus sp.]